MHSYDMTFRRLLIVAIEEERASRRIMATERPNKYEDYLYRIGQIEGLRVAVQLADDVERRMQGGSNVTALAPTTNRSA